MEKVMGTLAEQFQQQTGVAVTVEGGGSSAGIEAAASGTAEIGLSSRHLSPEETGLRETLLARDGIAVIVNGENPGEELTSAQVAGLCSGEVSRWSEVGGADLETACVGRESGSGTREGFESALNLEGSENLSQELTSTGAVIEAVRGNPQAVGYASLAFVEGQRGIRALRVDGASCTEESVRDGSYPIQRPFALITREAGSLSPEARAFLDFALSPEAAEWVRAAGAVPEIQDEEASP